ncbi:MAG: hypothetical protein EA382_08375 [Spirochaetaceae bacterium]|nr:MAG: hypothetical protein EA382_08375 [Spirochaetaceae bacterium]
MPLVEPVTTATFPSSRPIFPPAPARRQHPSRHPLVPILPFDGDANKPGTAADADERRGPTRSRENTSQSPERHAHGHRRVLRCREEGRMTDYLHWMANHTNTRWWADSIEPGFLDSAIATGATGATSNPFLVHQAIASDRGVWSGEIAGVLAGTPAGAGRAVELTRLAVTHAADVLLPVYERAGGADGYVCAQVDPGAAADRAAMLELARTYHAWRPNISVKLPTTAAGLDVLETCVAEGISCTMTVSFTAPQIALVADRFARARSRAIDVGREPGRCHAVMMIGRLDDYLRDVALDSHVGVAEADIRLAGIVTTRRVLPILQAAGEGFDLIVAALRGTHHLTALVGERVIMSIAPSIRRLIDDERLAIGAVRSSLREGDAADDQTAVARLSTLREFTRAYDPDGIAPPDFLTFGATQRTLAQFVESGWKLLEQFGQK